MTPKQEQYRRRKIEQEAKYKGQFRERWFGWWRNPPDRFAFLIAIFTGGLFAATGGLWWATKDLVEDARASGRAWIIPHLLRLEKPLKAGEDASLVLFFGNSGREPAIRAGHYHEGASLPVDVLFGDVKTSTDRFQKAVEKMDIPDTCELAAENKFNGVIYPGSIDGSTNSITIDKKWITDQVANGSGFLVVKGCFVYETIKSMHKSRYCFFYNGKIADMRPAEHRNFLQSCPGEKENDAN
jgi:hypothetical protein